MRSSASRCASDSASCRSRSSPRRSCWRRRDPTLIDLMVASLAGVAGALAMIDERVSPALPGVAIATALNPPIAAIGLCLALGAYEGAWGAFVLFFANVLAILAVAGVMFMRRRLRDPRGDRLAPEPRAPLLRGRARPAAGHGPAHELPGRHGARPAHRARDQRRRSTRELAQEPSTALVSVEFDRSREGLEVLSTVRTPRVIPPGAREADPGRARDRTRRARARSSCAAALTKDVTATGSTNLRPYLSLNGRVTEAPLAPEMRLLQQAEQVAREVAATRPEIVLLDIELVQAPSGPGARRLDRRRRATPRPRTSRASKRCCASGSRDPSLRVVVRRVDSTDITVEGTHPLRRGALRRRQPTEQRARRHGVEEAVRARIEALPQLFVTAIDAVRGRPRLERARRGRRSARADARGGARDREAGRSRASASRLRSRCARALELVVTGTRYEELGAARAPGNR